MRAALISILFIAATACDVGSEFEVIGDGPDIDLTGTWGYQAELIGHLVNCQVIGLLIHIEHEGGTLTGSTEGGTLECIFSDEVVVQPLAPMPLRDGVIVRTSLVMSFGEGQTWRHGGDVVTLVFMRGTTDMTRDFGGEIGVVELTTGEWSANRQ